MPMYAISLTTMSATATCPTDLLQVTASTRADLRLCGLILSRNSTAAVGTTAVEHLLIQVLRGSSANGATEAPGVANLDSLSRATAQFTAVQNTTAIGSAGSTVERLLSAAFNSMSGNFVWWPPAADGDGDQRPTVKLGQRLSVRVGPHATAFPMMGTVYVQELPKIPGSGRT